MLHSLLIAVLLAIAALSAVTFAHRKLSKNSNNNETLATLAMELEFLGDGYRQFIDDVLYGKYVGVTFFFLDMEPSFIFAGYKPMKDRKSHKNESTDAVKKFFTFSHEFYETHLPATLTLITQIRKLSDDSRDYLDWMVEEVRGVLVKGGSTLSWQFVDVETERKRLETAIEKFKALPAAAKEELADAFPSSIFNKKKNLEFYTKLARKNE